MIEFETIQEEVLNELFGTTNFASTIRGIFTGKTPDTALNPTKKVLDRKLNAANRIQRASGFLSDKSLNDVDIPTFLRKAMEKGADASKLEQSALRKTGYKVGPPGHNVYGKVGGAADTVSAETLAAAEKRRAVYAGKSYASIRETPDQTLNRLLKEMNLTLPSSKALESARVIDEATFLKIIDELLEAFMYDPKHHFTGGKEGGVPGPLSGMKFDTLQRALDAGAQLTPSGQPMGDWNHVIVAPEEASAKKVEAPQPPAEAAPEGDVQDKLDPMKRIQPLAAPVK